MTEPVHSAFSCWIVRKWSHCWWWRLRDTIVAHLDGTDDRPSPLPDVTEQNAFVSAITIQMCHCIRDRLTEYWATTNHFPTRFYSSAMQRNRYHHILHFLHFIDNNKPDMTDENSDGFWKTWNLFEILNKTFSQFYCPPEHLPVDEVLIFFKGRAIFRNTFPKTQTFWHQNLQTKWRDWIHVLYEFILSLMGVREFHIAILDSSSWMLQRWSTSVDTNSTQQGLSVSVRDVDAAQNAAW